MQLKINGNEILVMKNSADGVRVMYEGGASAKVPTRGGAFFFIEGDEGVL